MVTSTLTTASQLAFSMLRGQDAVILTQRQKAYLVSVARRCRPECVPHEGGWFIGPYTLLRGGRLARTDREIKQMEEPQGPETQAGDLDSFIRLWTVGKSGLGEGQVEAAKRYTARFPRVALAFSAIRDEIDNEEDRRIVGNLLACGR